MSEPTPRPMTSRRHKTGTHPSVAHGPNRPRLSEGFARVSWKQFLGVLAAYGLTSAVVGLGIVVGSALRPGPQDASGFSADRLVEAVSRMDGGYYLAIAREGYGADSRRPSNTAFFPLYPLASRAVHAITGWSVPIALLVVSHLALAGAMAVFWAYARSRTEDISDEVSSFAVLALALFPTTLFFRLAYSESLFMLLCVTALHAMRCRWPLWAVAAVVAAATAARPVGVALLPPLALEVWRQSKSRSQAAGRLAWLLPLAASGVLAYAAFLAARTGDPWALLKTQEGWQVRPPAPLGEKALALASWEPIWSVYDPGSPAWWQRNGRQPQALFSLHLANPVLFVAAAALIAFGAARRWLDAREILLAAGLLAIPYLTRSFEMCMMGHGRFAAAVVPMYLVLGRLLAAMPPVVAYGILMLFAVFLGIYSALFAAGYSFA